MLFHSIPDEMQNCKLRPILWCPERYMFSKVEYSDPSEDFFLDYAHK